jgi:hypothetical protein
MHVHISGESYRLIKYLQKMAISITKEETLKDWSIAFLKRKMHIMLARPNWGS